MQTSSRPARQNQSGYALVITLTFLVVTLIAFAAVMYWVSTNATVTQQNNLFTTSQGAAQGATETAITAMDRDFIYGSLNPSNVYMQLIQNIDQSSWPVRYVFSDTNGNQNQIYVSIQPQNWGTNFASLNAQFTGLYGAVANIDVIAVATPTNAGYKMSATVENQAQLAAIPVFQFGVFYNLDLDFSPGQPLTMNGKVHCNGNVWMCPQANAYFNDVVEASLVVTNHDNPNDQQNLTFNSSYLHYSLFGQPVSGVDSLNLPIGGVTTNNSPTNVETLFNLPPTAIAAPNTAAYDPTNQIYLYNECDLIISNSASGTSGALGTITIFYQDNSTSVSGGPLFQLTNNEICTYQSLKTGARTNALCNGTTTNKLWIVSWNATNLYYSTNLMTDTTNWVLVGSSFPFVTNVAFYDYREKDTVQAVQLDIAKLDNWLTNGWWEGSNWNYVCGGTYGMWGTSFNTGSKGHPIDSIFVYNSVPTTSSQLPAVRVVNGQQLPSHWGLTIATPMPIYTFGNYNIQTNNGGSQSLGTTNTAWTWPAALMGDAITILSAGWSDSNSLARTTDTTPNARPATPTTVNAAALEGIVQSTNVGSGTYAGKHYSGGLENFLRLLENWSGNTLTYNGSIVVMFPSIYATNFWIQPGTYYNVPTRNWGFDANFRYQQKSPPCAPAAKAIIRGNWTTSGK